LFATNRGRLGGSRLLTSCAWRGTVREVSTNRNTNSREERNMTFRVDRDLLRRFGVVAAANHRTASQELRLLMERHIAEAEAGATERAA
jgi:hypothetical protein